MDFVLTAIVFFLIFSVLVLIHELGHYFMARMVGIKVEEFGFGLPPRIWGVKKGDTIWSINAVPFGGFVKLLGEDASDLKLLKNKNSFIGKSMRERFLVIVAGVTMNFILAVLLLTVGFIVGIKPLLLNGDDVLSGISSGQVVTLPGIMVKDITVDGPAAKSGIMLGDRILDVNGKVALDVESVKSALKEAIDEPVVVNVARDEKKVSLKYKVGVTEPIGLSFYETVPLPRVAIKDVKVKSFSEAAGLKAGDIILSLNGQQIYFVEDFFNTIATAEKLEYMVLRGEKIVAVQVTLPKSDKVVVSNVYTGSNAEKAGLMAGDAILSLDGQAVKSPSDVVAVTHKNPSKIILYDIRRQQSETQIGVQVGENGLIGIGLSPISTYANNDLDLYSVDVVSSVIRIKDVTYPFYEAPVKALTESVRLGGLTIQMFVDVVKYIFTKFSVPSGVAGPVGIAQMTSVFMKEGIMSLLRFMALLSLSLAMINVIPFPALDGGRLLFIVIEMVIGRKVNPRVEAIVHTIGYALLMLLIVAVTYSDVMRLIFG